MTRRAWHTLRRHHISRYYAVRPAGSGYRDHCSCGADWAFA